MYPAETMTKQTNSPKTFEENISTKTLPPPPSQPVLQHCIQQLLVTFRCCRSRKTLTSRILRRNLKLWKKFRTHFITFILYRYTTKTLFLLLLTFRPQSLDFFRLTIKWGNGQQTVIDMQETLSLIKLGPPS